MDLNIAIIFSCKWRLDLVGNFVSKLLASEIGIIRPLNLTACASSNLLELLTQSHLAGRLFKFIIFSSGSVRLYLLVLNRCSKKYLYGARTLAFRNLA